MSSWHLITKLNMRNENYLLNIHDNYISCYLFINYSEGMVNN